MKTLALTGFGGICINRAGYGDHGEALVRDLDRVVGTEPIRAGNGELLFYDLTRYTQQLRATLDDGAWEAARTRRNRFCGPGKAGSQASKGTRKTTGDGVEAAARCAW